MGFLTNELSLSLILESIELYQIISKLKRCLQKKMKKD